MDDRNKIPIDKISLRPEISDAETKPELPEPETKPELPETKPELLETKPELLENKPELPDSKISTKSAGKSNNKLIEIIKNIIDAAVRYILLIGNDKTLIIILISIICLILDFLLIVVIILKYIVKSYNFKSIKNPIIKESPNFNAIVNGQIEFGIIIGLVGLGFILSIIVIILKIQKLKVLGNKLDVIGSCLINTQANSECSEKKEYNTLTLGIYIIITSVIQLPFIIPFYITFLRKQKFINNLIKNVNNNILNNLYSNADFLYPLEKVSSNDYNVSKTLNTALKNIFTDEQSIENIITDNTSLQKIISTLNLYKNYHNIGFNNSYLLESLKIFSPQYIVKTKLLNLKTEFSLNNIINGNSPINYFSYNTPHLIDYSNEIGSKISDIVIEKIYNIKNDKINSQSRLLNQGSQLSLEVGANLYDDAMSINTYYDNLIDKYTNTIKESIIKTSEIIQLINIDLSDMDFDAISNEYINMMSCSFITQIPGIILGIRYTSN